MTGFHPLGGHETAVWRDGKVVETPISLMTLKLSND